MSLFRHLCSFPLWSLVAAAVCHAGPTLDLSSLRGRVVYLDFWASWCAPCRQSFPWMQDIQDRFEARGLTVIAINLDHERMDAEAFLRRYHPGFAVRFDPEGILAEQFKVQGMPTAVIIDRQGTARFTHVGFRPGEADESVKQIQLLLEEP